MLQLVVVVCEFFFGGGGGGIGYGRLSMGADRVNLQLYFEL